MHIENRADKLSIADANKALNRVGLSVERLDLKEELLNQEVVTAIIRRAPQVFHNFPIIVRDAHIYSKLDSAVWSEEKIAQLKDEIHILMTIDGMELGKNLNTKGISTEEPTRKSSEELDLSKLSLLPEQKPKATPHLSFQEASAALDDIVLGEESLPKAPPHFETRLIREVRRAKELKEAHIQRALLEKYREQQPTPQAPVVRPTSKQVVRQQPQQRHVSKPGPLDKSTDPFIQARFYGMTPPGPFDQDFDWTES